MPRAITSGRHRAHFRESGKRRVHDGRARPSSAMPMTSTATRGTRHSVMRALRSAFGDGVTRPRAQRWPASGPAQAARRCRPTSARLAGRGQPRKRCDGVTEASVEPGWFSGLFRRRRLSMRIRESPPASRSPRQPRRTAAERPIRRGHQGESCTPGRHPIPQVSFDAGLHGDFLHLLGLNEVVGHARWRVAILPSCVSAEPFIEYRLAAVELLAVMAARVKQRRPAKLSQAS